MAAVINYHKISGLQQGKLVIILEVRSLNGFHWANIKMSAWLDSLQAFERSTLPCFFQLLEAVSILCFTAAILHFWLLSCHVSRGVLVPWPGIEPTALVLEVQNLNHLGSQVIPTFNYCNADSPASFSLALLWLYWAQPDNHDVHNQITSMKSLLPCEVTYSEILGIRTWTSLWDHHLDSLGWVGQGEFNLCMSSWQQFGDR